MKIWVYIERLAWGVFLLAFTLMLLLFYGLSGTATEPVYSWLFGDGSVVASAVFALSEVLSVGNGCLLWVGCPTILVAQMQRPLGVHRPLWFKLVMAPCAVLNLLLCFLAIGCHLLLLLETSRFGTFAVSLGYLLLLAFTVSHRSTRASVFGAVLLLVGFAVVISGVAAPELHQPFATITMFLYIVGLFVTSLFFRRAH